MRAIVASTSYSPGARSSRASPPSRAGRAPCARRPAFRNRAEQATGGEHIAGGGERRERPAALPRQRLIGGAPDQEIGCGGERAQHAIEDAPEQARPELGREREPTARDRLTGGESAGVLVHLDRRPLAFERDHLDGQPRSPTSTSSSMPAPCIAVAWPQPFTRWTLPVTPTMPRPRFRARRAHARRASAMCCPPAAARRVR